MSSSEGINGLVRSCNGASYDPPLQAVDEPPTLSRKRSSSSIISERESLQSFAMLSENDPLLSRDKDDGVIAGERVKIPEEV